MTTFPAFVAGTSDDGYRRWVAELTLDDLPADGVLVEVAYSGINYKDGLAATEKGRVARIDPIVPGIDLAGAVAESAEGFEAGQPVIAHGYDIGVARHGGYAGYARVPAGWIVPLPAGLDARQAMTVGTAGYTAALSIEALEGRGLAPGSGPVLVTGATGGVGSMAISMLARRGHEVVASTGKPAEADWLRQIGAGEIMSREEAAADGRPLESERWAGVVDCVGGATLAYALRTTRYGGTVTACGLTGGTRLPTTVLPFILRGVHLAGIDSVMTPIGQRIKVWNRIATDLRPQQVDDGEPATVGLDGLEPELNRILAGGMVGRTLVRPV